MHNKWKDTFKIALQSDQVLTKFKTINGHATLNVFKKHWSIINSTTSNPSSHSSPKPSPSPMFNETLKPSSKPILHL
jgi:hypothetical protein